MPSKDFKFFQIKNQIMEGKEMLNNCPQNVKDILAGHFQSLDIFYAYTYSIGIRQYSKYCRTKEFDTIESNRLSDYLCKIGIDEFIADDLISSIIGDYDEQRVETDLRLLLGENWREQIAAVEEMINSDLQ